MSQQCQVPFYRFLIGSFFPTLVFLIQPAPNDWRKQQVSVWLEGKPCGGELLKLDNAHSVRWKFKYVDVIIKCQKAAKLQQQFPVAWEDEWKFVGDVTDSFFFSFLWQKNTALSCVDVLFTLKLNWLSNSCTLWLNKDSRACPCIYEQIHKWKEKKT